MGLRDILKRDIEGREHLESVSAALVKHWNAELAKLPAQHIPLPRAGVDYAYGRPIPHVLRAAGVTFVGRYLGGTEDKDLTRDEAENLSGGGLDIVTFYENASTEALDGYSVGVNDARAAERQLAQIGAPAHAPIYFTCDFDVQEDQLGAVDEYFRGAQDQIGHDRIGIYGGLRVVSHLLANGRARYGCQTIAWSGGAWSTRAQLRQTQVSVQGDELHVAGISVDRLEAVAADFGQWKV